MTTLVTGVTGQLGRAVCRQLDSACIACDRQMLDITNPLRINSVIQQTKAKAVINCAAFTQVDAAETKVDECMAINATAVRYLSEACSQYDIPFMQVSTDYVFGGDCLRNTPYRETDSPAPLNVYGQSKLLSEQFASNCSKHFVIRTCGLYGHSTKSTNFVEKILNLAATQKRLCVVHDQFCSPTFVEPLAKAMLFLCESSQFGTYHLVNSQPASWYDFAVEILSQSKIDTPVDPINSDELRLAAVRPKYSVLDNSKYHTLGGPRLGDWRESLTKYLAQRQVNH